MLRPDAPTLKNYCGGVLWTAMVVLLAVFAWHGANPAQVERPPIWDTITSVGPGGFVLAMFLSVGFFATCIHPILALRRRLRTAYGLTPARLLVVCGNRIAAHDLADIAITDMTQRPQGDGSLTVTAQRPEPKPARLVLDNLITVQTAYTHLDAAQRRAAMLKEHVQPQDRLIDPGE